MKRIFVLIVVLCTAFLAGCAAPNVVSNVTVFHSLTGAETNKTYMIAATPEQANDLEFNSYATLLNQKLQQRGFTMVTKDPALKVSLKYGTSPTVASTLEPAPYYGYYRRGPSPSWQTSVDTFYMQQMEVQINQVADGKNIYSVRARSLSDNPELSESMDYLIESAFQNFPGKNGHTETVTVPTRPK